MRCPIHPEGFFFSGALTLLALVTSRCSRFLGTLFGLLAAFTVYFFRDPEREIPQGEGLIVSAADGTVVGVDDVPNAPFIDGPAKRVSIFLSIFNVHINRSPIDGRIAYRHYNPGKFLPANCDKASLDNEQNAIGIDDGGYKVLVRQIAGIIARRILCWVNPGDEVSRGERFGLIRFGSRTEILMPPGAVVVVKVGDKVKGGETVIARRS